ncbi:MAG: ribosome silencing factor [Gammaproteobacteria bacterium]|nr:ribosome silencing factor [Gammaproteobacteria bacterium]
MRLEELRDLVIDALEDMKATDVQVLDVRGKTSITDVMIIASGTSSRHVKSIAETVAFKAKDAGEAPLGAEGLDDGEWALVDLNEIILHVMQPKVREFYQLERLWNPDIPDQDPLVSAKNS